MKYTQHLAISAIGTLVLASSSLAQQSQVDLSGIFSSDMQTWTGGSNYQYGNSTLNVNGINFNIGLYNGQANTTGVATSGTPDNVMSVSTSILVGNTTTALYTLANSAWGTAGNFDGSVEVYGQNGETYTYNYTEGFNIRDHYNGSYTNTLSDASVISTYFNNKQSSSNSNFGPDRWDMQTIVLPVSFQGDIITKIQFINSSSIGNPQGEPAWVAATVAAVPEPMDMLSLAVPMGLFLIRKRRTR